jgi:serine phosphatase RsbU (regulator of sigma subunit)
VLVDSNFTRSLTGLRGECGGNIQLFWDGALVADTLHYRLPVSLHVGRGSHVLAVRYDRARLEEIHRSGSPGGFFLQMGDHIGHLEMLLQQRSEQMFFTGIVLSFGILHLMLFLFSPSFKGNLYYTIFLVLMAASTFLDIQQSFFTRDFDTAGQLLVFHRAVVPFTSIFFLRFLYSIFYSRCPRQFWILAGLMIVAGVVIVISPVERYDYYVYVSTLITIEMVRVLVVATRKRKPGAWIFAAGFACVGIFSGYDTLLDLNVMAPIAHVTNAYYFGFVGMMVAMSVHLAREFANTSKRLVEQVKRTQEEEIARQVVERDNARKTRELEDARQLQLSMLPVCRNDLPGLDICFHMVTASEVGGDYYDYYFADRSLTVAVGDATGHGMKAGTMVSIIKSLFITNTPIGDAPSFLRKCSEAIRGMRLGNLFMGLTLAEIKDGALTVSSAGMPPVLVYRSESRSVEEIVVKSMPLGGPGSLDYEVRKANLAAGDAVLLMSDGLAELFNPQDEMLDYPRVKNLFAESVDRSATEIAHFLMEQGRLWAEGRPQGDDVTLVVVKKVEREK